MDDKTPALKLDPQTQHYLKSISESLASIAGSLKMLAIGPTDQRGARTGEGLLQLAKRLVDSAAPDKAAASKRARDEFDAAYAPKK